MQNNGGTLLEHLLFSQFVLLPAVMGRLIPKGIIRFCKSVVQLCGFVHRIVCERNYPRRWGA